MTLSVRVVALDGADNRLSESDPITVTILPLPWTLSDRFEATDDQIAVSHEQIVQLGLDTWPDSQFGVVPTPTPGVYDFYANQGEAALVPGEPLVRAGITRTRGTVGNPVQQVISQRDPIEDLIQDTHYVAGGHVYEDPSGLLIMLYHHEKHSDDIWQPDSTFYTSLGAAVSNDNGESFFDLGLVLTPGIAEDSPASGSLSSGAGDASFVVAGEYMYVYSSDRDESGKFHGVTIGRIAVADLVAAAEAKIAAGPGQAVAPPEFKKWYDADGPEGTADPGGFTEEGIGGQSSDVLPGLRTTDAANVAWSECRQEFFMTSVLGSGPTDSQLGISTSPDGVHWSEPEGVYSTIPEYRYFNSMVGDLVDGHQVITDSTIDLLTVSLDDIFPNHNWWETAELRHVTITDHLAESEGCTSMQPPTNVQLVTEDPATPGPDPITLSWDAPVPRPAGYRAEWRPVGTSTWNPVTDTVDLSDPLHPEIVGGIPDLDVPMPIEARIVPIAGDGDEGPASEPVTGTLPAYTLAIAPVGTGLEPDEAGATAGVSFQVSLAHPYAEAVTVEYWTADGTASDTAAPGGVSDYVRMGTPTNRRALTIAAGATEARISVPARADTVNEADEDFSVHIASATAGVSVLKPSAQGVILDADSRSSGGSPVLVATNASAVEGDEAPTRRAQVYLRLSQPVGQPIPVLFWTEDDTAIAGLDYSARGPVTMTIPANQRSLTLDFLVSPDRDLDGDRHFKVHWEVVGTPPPGLVGTGGIADALIADDD